MPFIGRPEGFSPETLALLDTALSQIWLEQASIFVSSAASLSATHPQLLPQAQADASPPDTMEQARYSPPRRHDAPA